jgi:hypothetical protein
LYTVKAYYRDHGDGVREAKNGYFSSRGEERFNPGACGFCGGKRNKLLGFKKFFENLKNSLDILY